MPTFSTQFEPPDPVEGLVVEGVLEESLVRLSWSPTVIPAGEFGGYRVYRSLDGGQTYQLLVHQLGVNEVSYEDVYAPLNTQATYRVTQADLDYESAPASAAVTLASLAWWIVTPNDPTMTFPVTGVFGAEMTSPKVQELFSPVGRDTKLAVGDVVQTEDGSLTFRVKPNQPQRVALMKAVQAQMEGFIILKAPDGVVHQVQFGAMTRRFTRIPGLQELSIPFSGVS